MKVHTKKKLYRAKMRELARDGKINDQSGAMVNRPSGGNAMMRDYYPQTGKQS